MNFRIMRANADEQVCTVERIPDLDLIGWGASEKKGLVKRFEKLEDALNHFLGGEYCLADMTNTYGAISEWSIHVKR